MNKYFFILLFLCLGILIGSFSLYYYTANNSYYNYVFKEAKVAYLLNQSQYKLMMIAADNNMKYQSYLFWIIVVSLIDIIITFPLYLKYYIFNKK